MIKVSKLSKKFGQREIFNNISFSIEEGEFVAITGESGKGKTTLLNLISLLDQNYKGRIEIDGKAIFSIREIQMMQRYKFAYLFQNYALVENETVRQNLQIALKYRKDANQNNSIKKVLKIVGLEGVENYKIYELSGGEQQRVALARAYLKKPKYVFADEPTGNLDKHNRDIVFGLLRKMNQFGTTIIFVTHDMELSQSVERTIEV
jgi:ABC-type antimicrobial peptide transport system, ATPase component